MVKKVARDYFAIVCFQHSLHNFKISACYRHCGRHCVRYLPTFTVSSFIFPGRLLSSRQEIKQETYQQKDQCSTASSERLCPYPPSFDLPKNFAASFRSLYESKVNYTGISWLLSASIFDGRSSVQIIGRKFVSDWKPEGLLYNPLKTRFSSLHSTCGKRMASKRSQSEETSVHETQQSQGVGVVATPSEVTTKKRIHADMPKSSSSGDVSKLESSNDMKSSVMWKTSFRAKSLAVGSCTPDKRSSGDYLAKASSSDDVSRLKSSDDMKTSALWRPSYRERKLLLRPWQMTELGAKNTSHSDTTGLKVTNLKFTIASYNVLAQNLLEDNSYLYGYCNDQVLQWEFRRQQLLAEVAMRLPDILCCQEINEKHFKEFFSPAFEELGYKGEFKKRTRSMQDGCATFYKTSVFECISVNPIEYLKPGVNVLDRDNVALVLLLRPKLVPNASTRLCVANTHLLFNPRRGDVKLAQLMVLFAELDKLTFLHEQQTPAGLVPVYHPILFCGDLNMQPFSQLYRFVSSGILPLNGVTIRKLSGQEASVRSGTDNRILFSFLDRKLGISDSSQYVEVCRQRSNQTCKPFFIGQDHGSDKADEYTQGCGTLTHKLGFRSVYRHYTDYGSRLYSHRVPEVSTCHGNANCTVDYIFYSSGTSATANETPTGGDVSSESSSLAGNSQSQCYSDRLLLLSRLQLLSDREMHELGGLPNEVLSSDHLMLCAKFALEVD